jgi:hypothetical protein
MWAQAGPPLRERHARHAGSELHRLRFRRINVRRFPLQIGGSEGVIRRCLIGWRDDDLHGVACGVLEDDGLAGQRAGRIACGRGIRRICGEIGRHFEGEAVGGVGVCFGEHRSSRAAERKSAGVAAAPVITAVFLRAMRSV